MEVTIYGTTNCAFCKVEKEWLDSKSVSYSYVNIDEDARGKEFLDSINERRVPVTIINDGDFTSIIKGFDRVKLSEALNGY